MGDKTYELFCDIHESLPLLPDLTKCALVRKSYKYYHYNCDGFNDVGWGCGYRTLQTICSWVINAKQKSCFPPDIRSIQKILVDIEDKPKHFFGSREWIGCIEVSYILGSLFDIDCKIIHIPHGVELQKHVEKLYEHFENYGSPVMMGGENDNSSKGIMGIANSKGMEYLLIVDPHFSGRTESPRDLIKSNWIRWQPISNFEKSGYYNLLLPMCSSNVNS